MDFNNDLILQWGQYLVNATIAHNSGVGMSLKINLPLTYTYQYMAYTCARNSCEIVTGASLYNYSQLILGYTNHSGQSRELYSVMWFTI